MAPACLFVIFHCPQSEARVLDNCRKMWAQSHIWVKHFLHFTYTSFSKCVFHNHKTYYGERDHHFAKVNWCVLRPEFSQLMDMTVSLQTCWRPCEAVYRKSCTSNQMLKHAKILTMTKLTCWCPAGIMYIVHVWCLVYSINMSEVYAN